jgi:hypothetical protein
MKLIMTLIVFQCSAVPHDDPQVPASQRPNKFGPHELPLLVQLLWRDKHIFSKSWARDLWVVIKNRRASHPGHHPITLTLTVISTP